MSAGPIPFDVERYRSRRLRRHLAMVAVFIIGFALGFLACAVLSRLQ
jgi:hypothetical protein